jgi:probable phosphoglycerate mutase
MTATRVLLVRHGESTWNAVRRWQGQANPPLTDRGENQARRAATVARDLGPFDAIAASSLERAHRTAEIIATDLGVPLLDADWDLSERSAGEWEGLTRSQIEEAFPGYLAEGRRPKGYESDDSIVARASSSLRRLAADHVGCTLLVVSHGGIIHALERVHLGGDRWQRLDNLTGRWFEVVEGALRPVDGRIALVPDGGPTIPPPDPGYA